MSDKLSRSDNESQPENQPSRNQPETERPFPPRRNWLRFIFRYAAIYVAIILLFRFVIPSYMVEGSSMEPTYQTEGDRVLTDRIIFKLLEGPQRGEIVILDKSVTQGYSSNDDSLIKRVIGLPGENIEIRQGTVYINGEPMAEPYVQNHADYNYPATTLPAGCYFVLGDNRPISLDSHYFGCVNKDKILAKVLLKFPHL
ncbi:MAG: signal peptidase I [Chloroflexi bacterium]|nr:signal peptidase I [Chloroflexota bacterium]